MFNRNRQIESCKYRRRILTGMMLAVFSVTQAAAVTQSTLIHFGAYSSSFPTGAYPSGTLLRDASGALYGTNSLGGSSYNGTVYKLSPPSAWNNKWSFTLLYTFTGGSDGGSPNSNLVMDSSGALYGTAGSGGYWTNQGVVFKLTPPAPGFSNWTYTVLHRFYYSAWEGVPSDGANPAAGLVIDQNGVLYGTTGYGGKQYDSVSYIGYGTVFKLTPLNAAKTNWQMTTIYRFNGQTDGLYPMELTRDGAGNLYGTTMYGGTGNCTSNYNVPTGCGTVFRLSPPEPGQTQWTKATLRHFAGRPDGARPLGKLLLGASGALIGATYMGGNGLCSDSVKVTGCGTVYRLSPPASGQTNWTYTVIHEFDGTDGASPQGGVIADASGALYGTTTANTAEWWFTGVGTLYKLTAPPAGQTKWSAAVLYFFNTSDSGHTTLGELVRAPDGRLFGTAYLGGSSYAGTVYQITP